MRSNTCPKCQGSMAVGFIARRTDNWRKVANWVEGPPARSLWFGVNVSKTAKQEIQTWRCVKCGFLESYAQ